MVAGHGPDRYAGAGWDSLPGGIALRAILIVLLPSLVLAEGLNVPQAVCVDPTVRRIKLVSLVLYAISQLPKAFLDQPATPGKSGLQEYLEEKLGVTIADDRP